MTALASPSAGRKSWACRGHPCWEFPVLGSPCLAGYGENFLDQVMGCAPHFLWCHWEKVTRRLLQSACLLWSILQCHQQLQHLSVEEGASGLVGRRVFYGLLIVSGSPNRSSCQFCQFSFPWGSGSVCVRNVPTRAAICC